MITEDYVSLEVAKLLKEKGFDESTEFCFIAEKWESPSSLTNSQLPDGRYSRPTLQMAMKWLREVHKIGIFPTTFYRHTKTFHGHNYGCTLVNLKSFDIIGNFEDCTFPADTYEQSVEKAIVFCLKNLI